MALLEFQPSVLFLKFDVDLRQFLHFAVDLLERRGFLRKATLEYSIAAFGL